MHGQKPSAIFFLQHEEMPEKVTRLLFVFFLAVSGKGFSRYLENLPPLTLCCMAQQDRNLSRPVRKPPPTSHNDKQINDIHSDHRRCLDITLKFNVQCSLESECSGPRSRCVGGHVHKCGYKAAPYL
jgi:hypothetical protein